MQISRPLAALAALLLSTAQADPGDWQNYGGTAGGTRYAPLVQITPANVGQLQLAWSYELPPPIETVAHPYVAFEGTPLEVGGTVYFCTPNSAVVALDAQTGQQRWIFAPHLRKWGGFRACRGVAYYEMTAPAESCHERIIATTVDARMYAVDAKTGALCAGFGSDGYVDLLTDMGQMSPGVFTATSAPTIVRGRVVTGGMVMDNGQTSNPSGVVRAYDATTGALAWAWDLGHPDRHGAPPAGEIYTRNTPNAWGPFSADEAAGLVFVPTGNSNPDYYGAQRSVEAEKYSSAVVALDATSGEVRWSFQTTHHDLWDYDVGSQPVLYDLPTAAGGIVPVLIQPTKRGEIFVLNRRDGHPIMPVVERPVPQGNVPGDRTAATQPFSTGVPSLSGPELTEEDMWGLTPVDQLWCRIRFRQARYDGPMTPPTADRPWIYTPGWMGGSDWGGVSIDEARHVLVAVSLRMANYDRFVSPQEAQSNTAKGLITPQVGSPFGGVITDYFHSPVGMPCQRPPYGVISAINLQTGQMLWSHPLGTSRSNGPLGLGFKIPASIPMGNVGLGGNLVTGSGLIFVGATLDRYVRALDERTGQELWRSTLSAAAFATPMSYVAPGDGRQYVLVSVGGNSKFGPNQGLFVQAYALPVGKAN